MGRKLFIWLTPLLGIVAFAVTPMAAQAASPHYYVGGSLVAEGEKVPVIAWGKLTLESEPVGTAAPVTCENAVGGFLENPAGGGSGRGQTTRFSTWNCADIECAAGQVEIGGKKFEKEFEVVSPPQNLPWPNEITVSGTTTKLNSTGVVVTLGCYAHQLTKLAAEGKSPPGSGENEQFPLQPPTRCETTATHLQDPQNKNGENLGNLQAQLIFNQPAGSGLSCASGAVTGKTTGTLKTMGYAASEEIKIKTP